MKLIKLMGQSDLIEATLVKFSKLNLFTAFEI